MEREAHRWLRERLTEKRYLHSLAVSERAAFLANFHGGDADKAALAGLLHDCCHCMPYADQLKIINSRGILLDDFAIAQPQLWHAIAGSIAVQSELGVHDGEIISAVRLHTTGGKNMTALEQIVYLADLTSADRDYPEVEEYRALSEESLPECMLRALRYTIGKLAEQNAPIAREAWEAYNYFWSRKQDLMK